MTAAYVLVKVEATSESIARGVALMREHIAPSELVVSTVSPQYVAQLDRITDQMTDRRHES